jgi:hypothetical protein
MRTGEIRGRCGGGQSEERDEVGVRGWSFEQKVTKGTKVFWGGGDADETKGRMRLGVET